MFYVIDFRSLDHVLAVELFQIISVLVELGDSKDTPCSRKRTNDFVQVQKVGFDDLDTFCREVLCGGRFGVPGDGADW